MWIEKITIHNLTKYILLIENLNITAANPVMQNLLQNLEVFPKCTKYIFWYRRLAKMQRRF